MKEREEAKIGISNAYFSLDNNGNEEEEEKERRNKQQESINVTPTLSSQNLRLRSHQFEE